MAVRPRLRSGTQRRFEGSSNMVVCMRVRAPTTPGSHTHTRLRARRQKCKGPYLHLQAHLHVDPSPWRTPAEAPRSARTASSALFCGHYTNAANRLSEATENKNRKARQPIGSSEAKVPRAVPVKFAVCCCREYPIVEGSADREAAHVIVRGECGSVDGGEVVCPLATRQGFGPNFVRTIGIRP